MDHPFAQMTRAHAHRFVPALRALLRGRGAVLVDLAHTRALDAAGAAALWRLHAEAQAQGRVVQVTGAQEGIARALALYDAPPQAAVRRASALPALAQVGEATLGALDVLRRAMSLQRAMLRGLVAPSGARALLRPEILRHMLEMGAQAVPVVALIAFLVGVTVALQSAAQLRQFGAGPLVADLIGVAVTRELGPLMAAVLVAGRSGSAMAAELASMAVTEELDALRVMGLSPVRFLVTPRLVALLLVQPMLTLVADVVGILGGMLVARVALDVSTQAYLQRLQEAVTLGDLALSLGKGALFGWLIVVTGAVSGFNTAGGPDAVGHSTTRSVVAAIFAIIAADALVSFISAIGG